MLTALLLFANAHAGYPDDVVLSGLGTYDGDTVTNTSLVTEGYEDVVRELGFAIANKPMAPGETLGLNGFEVALSSTWAFIDARGEGDRPSGWERVHEDNDPSGVLWMPWLGVRKGLPLSLEVGANFGYIAFSRQTVFGGYGRWGLVEGYRNLPDLTVQVGYAGYVGNEELELGALDASGTIGYTLPFGTLVGINQAQFSPYVGAGVVRIHATPRLSAEDQEDLGVGAVSGFRSSDSFKEGFAPFSTHLGFRLVSGDFEVKVAGAFAPRALPTVSMGFGFEY